MVMNYNSSAQILSGNRSGLLTRLPKVKILKYLDLSNTSGNSFLFSIGSSFS